jgi:hypothetical protein
MKFSLKHILILLAACILIISSCGRDDEKVISRGDMAKIYAEMLVVDQWIQLDQTLRKKMDTTLVYEPILEKYGYDSEDYRNSVYRYLDDPERFAKILREASEIIDERLVELKKLKEAEDLLQDKNEDLKQYRVEFNAADRFPYMYDEPFIHYHDSLAVDLDTLNNEYRFKSVELADTVYEGVLMIVKADTVAVTDTMPAADSIMLKEGKPVKKMVEPKDRIVRKPAYAKDLQKNKGDFKVITDLNK